MKDKIQMLVDPLEERTRPVIEAAWRQIQKRIHEAEQNAVRNGVAYSSKLDLKRVTVVEEELTNAGKQLVALCLRMFGRKASSPDTQQKLLNALGQIDRQCREKAIGDRAGIPVSDSLKLRYETNVRKIQTNALRELQDGANSLPSFWQRKKDDLLLAAVTGLIGAILGIAGTLFSQWLSKTR